MEQNNILQKLSSNIINLFRGSVKDTDAYLFALENARKMNNVSYSGFNSADGRMYETMYVQMIDDPIVRRSLDAIIESAFQPYDTGAVIRSISDIPTLQSEIDDFLKELPLSTLVPKICFELLYKGNIRCKVNYDDKNIVSHITLLDDWRKITPFVYGGETLLYIDSTNTNEIYDKWEYVDTQLNTLSPYGNLSLCNIYIDDKEYQNEFVQADSWLRPAVEPWRRYILTLLSLVSSRINNLNHKRILFLPTQHMIGKTTGTYLNFFSDLFSGTRNFRKGNQGGIINSVEDFGAIKELIIPFERELGKPEISEIGGQEDVNAIKDLEENRSTLSLALRVPVQYLGFNQEGSAGLSGESPTSRYDESFGRAVKQVQSRVLDLFTDVVFYYLLSKGYNVGKKDFSLVAVVPSSVDDEKKRISVRVAVDNLQQLMGIVPDDSGFDKNALLIDTFNKSIGTQIGVNLLDFLDDMKQSEEAQQSKIVQKLRESLVTSRNRTFEKSTGSLLSKHFEGVLQKFMNLPKQEEKTMVKSDIDKGLTVDKVINNPLPYEWREDYLEVKDMLCVDDEKCDLKNIGIRAIIINKVVSLGKEVKASDIVSVMQESDPRISKAVLLDDGVSYGVSGRDIAVALVLRKRDVIAQEVPLYIKK